MADRERVGFEALGARVDLFEATAHVGRDVARASTESLTRAAGGALAATFSKGSISPTATASTSGAPPSASACARFGFRSSMRSSSGSQVQPPSRHLRYARERLGVDPLCDIAHAAIVTLLARLGRNAEANAQVETCRRILDRELGGRRSAALDLARMEIGKTAAGVSPYPSSTLTLTPTSTSTSTSTSTGTPPNALVARSTECAALAELVASAVAGRTPKVAVLSGEPGIGKTRLLVELERIAHANGTTFLKARAFEAEAVRPFGIWVDMLRGVPLSALNSDLKRSLAPLLPELGESPADPESKARLFDGVAHLLRDLASRAPVILAVDDLHWLDEASSSLLHYVARVSVGTRLSIVCATREGELEDNQGALRFVRALRREERLLSLAIAPLDESATAALVSSAVGVTVDAGRVFRESGGNPLFALEVAWAAARGTPEGPQAILELLQDRLARIDARAKELVAWAAALGREFDPEVLAAVAGESLVNTIGALGELERHGLVKASRDQYAFAHELFRNAAYRHLSGPRRRIVHLSIARTLAARPDPGPFWGDVVHHASLADDPSLVATACVHAGERALRMLARSAARDFAARGLLQTVRLGAPSLSTRIRLIKIAATSVVMSAQRQAAFELDAEDAVRAARESGRADLEADAFMALAYFRSARGDFEGTHEVMRGVTQAARAIPPAESVPLLANTAFCLAHIERELPRARALLDEAAEIAKAQRLSVIDLEMGDGCLAHLEGNLGHAGAALDRSLALARARADAWRESATLIRKAMIAVECETWESARAIAAELSGAAYKLGGEGSEGVTADAFEALALCGSRDPEGPAKLGLAIEGLAKADAKAMLAYVLTIAAEMALARSPSEAKALAERALRAAEPLGKPSALILARVLLGRCALAMGRRDKAQVALAEARGLLEHPFGVSKRARDAVVALEALSNADPNGTSHGPKVENENRR